VAVTLVFHSGTRQECSVRGEVVARDPEQDLAVLRVHSTQKLPIPIELGQGLPLIETLPVFVFAFPFGEALATNQRNPEITVSRGSVSSIRRDERDRVVGVQIDGALNPGNSGGPVVDAEGRLIGVAVAAIRGANIGMAIPSDQVRTMLDGRVGPVSLVLRKLAGGQASVDAEVPLIDPLGHIHSASLLYVRAEKAPGRLVPDNRGNWPRLVGATELPLTIKRPLATVGFPMNGLADRNAALMVQVVYDNGSDRPIYSQPVRCRLNSTGTRDEMARGGAFPEAAPFHLRPSSPSVTQVQGGRL
jgi:hypothetical protein